MSTGDWRRENTMITETTGQDFNEQVLKSELPVFTCFVAQWCHSCFPSCLFAEELAGKYQGKVKFVKIDAEKSPEISHRYHILALPSIILFQDSQPVKKLPGYQEKTRLSELLDALLAER
jgi:thioredoxin 1